MQLLAWLWIERASEQLTRRLARASLGIRILRGLINFQPPSIIRRHLGARLLVVNNGGHSEFTSLLVRLIKIAACRRNGKPVRVAFCRASRGGSVCQFRPLSPTAGP